MLDQPARLSVARTGAAVSPATADPELVALVRAGAAGDPVALGRLVDRFDRALRSVARSYSLSSWDADDVVQATWLQFIQHGRGLREPAAVAGWLMTTARRKSMRMLQRHVSEQLTDDPAPVESGDHAEPERELLEAERWAAVRDALAQLPRRQQRLLRVLMTHPDLSYEDVGRMLAMPVGSIGPTRARSLERLRRCGSVQALASM